MLTEWYFAANSRGLSQNHTMILKSIKSCLRTNAFNPNLIYCGDPNVHLDKISKAGVNIILHKSSLEDELRYAYKDRYEFFSGHWLRCDLPLLCKTEKYVLYTDIDVIFLDALDFEPAADRSIYVAAEQIRGSRTYFNSGVMLMDVQKISGVLDDFHQAIRNRLKSGFSYPPHDQGSFNEFFLRDVGWLGDEMNWKPYWGLNPAAKILHFHGPKPEYIKKLVNLDASAGNAIYNALYKRDPVAYQHFIKIYDAI